MLTDHIDLPAGRIAIDVLGADRPGPPVVLTHGTPSWSHLWRHLAPALAAEHPVYLWDLPGYGGSALADGVMPSIALHARTLAALVGHWGLEAPVLIGHDIGAATVLRAHLVHDVAARSLVVADAAAISPWLTGVTQHTQAHLEAYRTMPTHVFGALIAAHLHTTTYRPMSDDAARAYLDRYAGAAGQRRYLDQVAGFTEDDTRDVVARLGEITVPTDIVWGAQDTWLPLTTAETLRDAIPGARLTVVPDAGHFLTEDAPDAVLAVVTAALTDTLSRS